MNYPNDEDDEDDEDGEALQMLSDSGIDMTIPLNIEFAIDAPNEESANSIKIAVKKFGFDAEIIDEDEGELDDGEEMTGRMKNSGHPGHCLWL